MKRSDITLIIVCSIIGLFISYYAVNTIAGPASELTAKIKRPNTIKSSLAEIDPEVFNYGAVNPTIEVYIGSCVDSNQNGFLDPIEKLECATPENRRNLKKTEEESK